MSTRFLIRTNKKQSPCRGNSSTPNVLIMEIRKLSAFVFKDVTKALGFKLREIKIAVNIVHGSRRSNS